MDGWDVAKIVGITSGVCVPVTGVLTLLLTRGIDAWKLVRLTKLTEKKYADGQGQRERAYEDSEAKKAYDLLTQQLIARIHALEAVSSALTKDHLECVKQFGILTGKADVLFVQNGQMVSKMAIMQSELDKLSRHESVQKLNVEQLKETLQEKILEKKIEKAVKDSAQQP